MNKMTLAAATGVAATLHREDLGVPEKYNPATTGNRKARRKAKLARKARRRNR